MNVRVVGAGETAEALRAALARVGLSERAGEPSAFVCGHMTESTAVETPAAKE